jgi:hypothetical protein
LMHSAVITVDISRFNSGHDRRQIPLPVQGEGKRAWRARVRAASTQSLISIQAAHVADSFARLCCVSPSVFGSVSP